MAVFIRLVMAPERFRKHISKMLLQLAFDIFRSSWLCCTNRVYRLLGDRFVTNEPEDAEAASEAVPYEELEGV